MEFFFVLCFLLLCTTYRIRTQFFALFLPDTVTFLNQGHDTEIEDVVEDDDVSGDSSEAEEAVECPDPAEDAATFDALLLHRHFRRLCHRAARAIPRAWTTAEPSVGYSRTGQAFLDVVLLRRDPSSARDVAAVAYMSMVSLLEVDPEPADTGRAVRGNGRHVTVRERVARHDLIRLITYVCPSRCVRRPWPPTAEPS